MTTFRVQTEELLVAATAVTRTTADLGSAEAAVNGTSGAAAGTPAAGAYDALLGDANTTIKSLQTAVDGLSRALNTSATNYVTTDQSTAACYATPPGGG
jgi:hypothetical protein